MSYYKGQTEYKFTWSQVVQGFWQKYPNPHNKKVITIDVIERKVIDGKLYTKQLIAKKGKVPKYLQKYIGGKEVMYTIQESVVDMEMQQFVTYTRNIEMENILSAHERCVFRPNPANKSEVICQKEMFISSEIKGFGGLVSAFALSQYRSHLDASVQGFNHVLCEMFNPICHEADNHHQQCKTNRRLNYLLQILKTIQSKVKDIIFPRMAARFANRTLELLGFQLNSNF